LGGFVFFFFFFISMYPVQLPLHEPYFDFTLIIAPHTKKSSKHFKKPIFLFNLVWISKLIAKAIFSVWRVISTNPKCDSPCHDDTRLLAITNSRSRISDYNPCLMYILFFEISLNSHFRFSLLRNMQHVYSPQY